MGKAPDTPTQGSGALTVRIPPTLYPLIFALMGGAVGGGGAGYLGRQGFDIPPIERRLNEVESEHKEYRETLSTVRDNQLLICQSLNVECER